MLALRQQARVNVHQPDPHTFSYGGKTYYRTGHDVYKLGEEVIWLLPREQRNPRNPLIGTIQMIGRNATNNKSFAAVVQFDEPTHDLPKYVQVGPKNRNIILLEDLLHLKVWSEAMRDLEGTLEDSESISDNGQLQEQQSDDLISFDDSASTAVIGNEEEEDRHQQLRAEVMMRYQNIPSHEESHTPHHPTHSGNSNNLNVNSNHSNNNISGPTQFLLPVVTPNMIMQSNSQPTTMNMNNPLYLNHNTHFPNYRPTQTSQCQWNIGHAVQSPSSNPFVVISEPNKYPNQNQ